MLKFSLNTPDATATSGEELTTATYHHCHGHHCHILLIYECALVIQAMERWVSPCLVSDGDEVAEADNRCRSRCSRQPNDEMGNLGRSLITSWVKWHMERSESRPCWCCELHTTDAGFRLSASVQGGVSVIFTSFFFPVFRKLVSISFFSPHLSMQRQLISGWYFILICIPLSTEKEIPCCMEIWTTPWLKITH